MLLEICVDSVQSAINAEKGGASRVELCANLMEGGTTPSLGMLKIIKKLVSVPVFVIIRPRGGDFVYSESEFWVMKEDLKCLKSEGADGIVLGILEANGEIDRERCQELIDISRPLPVTFHRAFDMVRDPVLSLDILVSMGVERILTSGLDSTALEGLPIIKILVEHANKRIIIMPGGGITERNLERIVQGSGAVEFHCSAGESVDSPVQKECRRSNVFMGGALRPPEFLHKYTGENMVKRLCAIVSQSR